MSISQSRVLPASLFIRDLLAAHKSGDVYVHKNISFEYVSLCGTITEVREFRKNDIEHIFQFIIDDGSGCIKCILEWKKCNEEKNYDLYKFKKATKANPGDLWAELNFLTLHTIDKFAETYNYKTFIIGDDVQVFGKMERGRLFRQVRVLNVEKKKDDYKNNTLLYEFLNKI